MAIDFPDSPTNNQIYTSGGRSWSAVYDTTTTRTNLIQNPNFEVNTSTWTVQNGATIARTTLYQYFGTASLLITSSATNYNGASIGANRVSVVAGTTYYLSAYVRNVSGNTRNIYIGIQWYDSIGTYISEVNSASQGTLSTAAGWVRRYATGTAPANATSANIFITSGTTGLSAGWETAADSVLFETGSTLLPYFDGTYADTYTGYTLSSQSWSGTSNASTSTAIWGLDSTLNWKSYTATITSDLIANGSITSAMIANGTIVAADIADYTISNTKIANASITNTQIASATITNTQIASGTITNTQLAANVAATNLGFTPASTGKSIAMAIVFGG